MATTYTKAGYANTAGTASGGSGATTASGGGVSVAFGTDALAARPVWTRIDDPAGINVVTGWQIKRGRSYFTDHTDTGSAQVDFIDTAGIMDPTNSTGPFYPMNPNCPFAIALQNPVTGTRTTLFTGLVQQVPQTLDVSARFARGSLHAADLFSLLANDEVPPGVDYADSTTGTNSPNTIGDTTYAAQTVQDRIKAILADAGVPSGLTDIFSGNVNLQFAVESPGSKILEMLWNAAEAEFPGVAILYVGKDGVVNFRGRLARFNPTNYASFGIHTWNVGDTTAVASHSTWALLSELSFDRDIEKIYNAALFTPDKILDADISGQLVANTASIATYGNRAYPAGMNLLTQGGSYDGLDANAETKLFSNYYVDNFHDAQTRITQAVFRTQLVSAPNAAAQWAFLCGVEISDVVNITTSHPGGGGFSAEPYFVEGISYEATNEGGANFQNVTLTLDLSPVAYYSSGWPPA